MNSTWRERFTRWLCSKIGHWSYIDRNSMCGSAPEVCRCCGRLLSTAYSRSRSRLP